MALSSSEFVTFNVAGRPFTTLRSTVLKEPAGRLALMLRSVIPAVQDSNGAYFIDRDPKHFALVLNFLRDGWCTLPKEEAERRELLQEVRFFQLAGMEAWMRTQEPPVDKTQDTSCGGGGSTCSYGRTSPTSVLHLQHAPSHLPQTPNYSPTHSPHYSPSYSSGGCYSSSQPAQQHQTYSLSSRPSSAAATLASEVLHSQMESNFARASLLGPSAVAPMQPSPIQQPVAPYSSYTAAAAGVMARLSTQRSAPVDAFGRTSSLGLPLTPAEQTVATAGSSVGSKLIPAPMADDGFKWTSKYLKSNERLREVVNTLLELAYLPPHKSLQGGKVHISISVDCEHDRISSMLGSTSTEYLRSRYQVVRVKGALGWAFEFNVRPSSELSLFEKYNMAEYIQDNWFVLSAVLKDQYGIVVEEDASVRPSCSACRRANMALTMAMYCH